MLAWLDRYPIVSLEDGLAEEDWAHWPALRVAVAGRALVLGDDMLCTNPTRIRRAIAAGATDALLLKVNQNTTASWRLKRKQACRWSIGRKRSGAKGIDWTQGKNEFMLTIK